MRVRLCLILVVGGFLFLAVSGCQPPPTPAPVENVIRYGDTVQGTLGQAQTHWSFIGSHDDNIAIDFTSTGAPPAVTVIGPSGESVARLSSTGHLEKFRLPDDGEYVIVIASGVGGYALVLRQ